MKVTVYLPDDLGAQVQQHADLNVSAVTQRALREELQQREAAAKLRAGMERIKVRALETHEGDVAFVGRELAYREQRPESTAYLTKGGKIAVYDNDYQGLFVYDSFAELAGHPGWAHDSSGFVARIGEALGEEYVVELDI